MLTGFHFFPSNTLGFYLLTLNTKIATFTITIFKTINNYFLESFFVQIYNILKVEHIHKTKSSDFLEFFALVLFFFLNSSVIGSKSHSESVLFINKEYDYWTNKMAYHFDFYLQFFIPSAAGKAEETAAGRADFRRWLQS